MIKSTILSVLALVLLSCGGDNSGVGVGGTGTTTGPVANGVTEVPVTVTGQITGFGSVIVSGIKFDDSSAIVLKNALGLSSLDLALGMTVELVGVRFDSTGAATAGTTGKADQIRIISESKGPVQSLDANAGILSVLGVNVRVDANTVFEGSKDLTGISVGDSAEIYGFRLGTDASVVATRIEVTKSTSPTAPVTVNLQGIVSALDANAMSFLVGSQRVNYGAAFVSGTLANGSSVQIQGTLSSGSNQITASSISAAVPSTAANGGRTVEFTGVVSSFVSRGSFSIGSYKVDASSAAIANGELAKLKDGARCEVHGVYANLIVNAIELSCEESNSAAQNYEITAAISRFGSVSDFVARGQKMDASLATFKSGKPSDLAVGKRVNVKGPIVAGVLKVTTLSFED